MIPRAVESLGRVLRLSNLKKMWNGMKHCSLSRVVIGECPSWESQMLKSPKMMPTPLGYASQCGRIRRSLPRNCLKVSSGSKWTLTITRMSPILHVHSMVTALASNHVCHKIQAEEPSFPAFSFPGMEVPKKTKSRNEHLNSLEILILSANLLET